MRMAYPFMPIRPRKLRKLTKKRKPEDSDPPVTVFNRPFDYKTHCCRIPSEYNQTITSNSPQKPVH